MMASETSAGLTTPPRREEERGARRWRVSFPDRRLRDRGVGFLRSGSSWSLPFVDETLQGERQRDPPENQRFACSSLHTCDERHHARCSRVCLVPEVTLVRYQPRE